MTAHTIAAQLAASIQSTVSLLRSQAAHTFELVNTPNMQQAILDAIPDFGVSAVEAVGVYAAMHGALAALGKSEGLGVADFAIFQPQEDGSVLYVAPVIAVIPELEPEP